MSAIVDEANDDLQRVDASDIETARNIGLEDDMFPPVQELMEESSKMPDIGARIEQHSDQDSILSAVNQLEEEDKDGGLINEIRKYKASLQRSETENFELRNRFEELEQ